MWLLVAACQSVPRQGTEIKAADPVCTLYRISGTVTNNAGGGDPFVVVDDGQTQLTVHGDNTFTFSTFLSWHALPGAGGGPHTRGYVFGTK